MKVKQDSIWENDKGQVRVDYVLETTWCEQPCRIVYYDALPHKEQYQLPRLLEEDFVKEFKEI